MKVHVRVCRDCGEEYRPGIATCADCGGELEDRYLSDDEEATASVETPPETGPDLSQHRPVFASGRAADLVPLAEELTQAGVPFHLAETPAEEGIRAASFSLLVHEKDVPTAQRALAPLLNPEDDAQGSGGPETGFEEGRGYVRCPACGHEQSPGATECPECGLTLGPGEEAPTCPRCGSPLPEPGAECPACGGS
jgi:hypothetical protein